MMRALVVGIATLLVAQSPAIGIAARARAMQPGELVVLSLTLPPSAGRPIHVRAFGRDAAAYRADDGGWRALVGIDLDVKPGSYPVTV